RGAGGRGFRRCLPALQQAQWRLGGAGSLGTADPGIPRHCRAGPVPAIVRAAPPMLPRAARMEARVILCEFGPDGKPVLFRDPREVLVVTGPEDVASALDHLEARRRQGAWIAGYLSYELGYALEP